jgi:hypothetical protein
LLLLLLLLFMSLIFSDVLTNWGLKAEVRTGESQTTLTAVQAVAAIMGEVEEEGETEAAGEEDGETDTVGEESELEEKVALLLLLLLLLS